jgi:hypothetical protein
VPVVPGPYRARVGLDRAARLAIYRGSDLEVKASRLLFFIRLFPAGFARVYFLICLEKQKHRVSHSCDVSYGRVVAGLADSVQWHHVRRLTFFGLLSPS